MAPGAGQGAAGLVDQYGRELANPWAPPRDPLANVDASRDAEVVFRDIPITTLTTWTISEIRAALSSHMIGQFAGSALLSDAIMGDDRVQATMGSRTSGVFGRPVIHTPNRASKREERAQWRKAWRRACGQGVMSEVVRWAIMLGFAVCELVWDTSVTPWQFYLKPWHPQYIYWRYDTRRYVAITQDGPVDIVPGNGKWFLYKPHGFYRGWAQGAVRAISDKWLVRQDAIRDWARFSEVHGQPIIKAKVPAMGDAGQKSRFVSGLSHLTSESVVMLPQNVDGTGYDVGLLEAMDQSWESFKNLIDRMDMCMVLPILWQNLTTEVKEGSFAAARMHGDVRQAALTFDDATLSDDAYDQLARPWWAFNYGNPDAASRTHYDITPYEDKATQAQMLAAFCTAVRDLAQGGKDIDVAAFAAAYGLKIRPEWIKKIKPIATAMGASPAKAARIEKMLAEVVSITRGRSERRRAA